MEKRELASLKLLGHVLVSNRRVDDALVLFEGLAELAPDDAFILKCLTWLYVEAGRHEEALPVAKRCARVLRTPAEQAMVRLLMARAYTGLGRDAEAAKAASEYLSLRNQEPAS